MKRQSLVFATALCAKRGAIEMSIVKIVPVLSIIMASLAFPGLSWGQRGGPALGSLKTVPVPQPTNIGQYVKDQSALVVLGKALFWDAQVGSDGQTACASCHFHAGADHRIQNILAPPTSGGGPVAVNQTVAASNFPFHQLSNVGNNSSTVVKDTRQAAGSAGVLPRSFTGLQPGEAAENGTDIIGGTSSLGGINVRQVGNRNSPTVINAVFNVRNFWDGRASRLFTGQTPFGSSDSALNAVVLRNGQLVREAVAINNASLASQAVGPPMNTSEMSYLGRSWPLLGRKMLAAAPLARQNVAADDSVLGPLANTSGNGLQPAFTYVALIQKAFQPGYWSGNMLVDGQFTQLESNFPLFWGLAIQAYESTLVSDNARIDQFLEGKPQSLSTLEQQGLQAFQRNDSQCVQCHQGPEFTAASYTNSANTPANNADPDNAGYFRTGVSPLANDTGFGGTDGFGRPLFAASQSRANGTFKAPGLRNVEFTGPYFHDGSQATLEQVLQFYSRNGDFPAGGNLGPGIGQIRLTTADQTAIVAFLKMLSDDRVRYEQAPFDHPSLCVSKGAAELSPGLLALDASDAQFKATSADKFALIPAVGKAGNAAPLQTFDELLAGTGGDGSRAHSLTESCSQIAASPIPRIDAVTNAATFQAGGVSPGEIVTLFGANLTGSVTFDGTLATTVYASSTQVSVTVPYAVAGSATTLRMGSTSLQTPVVPSSPGIFAAVSGGSDVLTLYATGGGSLSQDSLPRVTLDTGVTVNGSAAQVLYAGAAPGLVEGANQINVRLPAGVQSGTLSIVWRVGANSSKAFVFEKSP